MLQFDAYDYQLLAQAEGEGMFYRGERLTIWEDAASECEREGREFSRIIVLDVAA